METEDNREDSIIKVRVVSEQDSNQGALEQEDSDLRQVKIVSEREASDLRQVKIVSEQAVLGQQDKAITMAGLVEIFNNSIR